MMSTTTADNPTSDTEYRSCADCGDTKPASAFRIDRIRTDGSPAYRTACAACDDANRVLTRALKQENDLTLAIVHAALDACSEAERRAAALAQGRKWKPRPVEPGKRPRPRWSDACARLVMSKAFNIEGAILARDPLTHEVVISPGDRCPIIKWPRYYYARWEIPAGQITCRAVARGGQPRHIQHLDQLAGIARGMGNKFHGGELIFEPGRPALIRLRNSDGTYGPKRQLRDNRIVREMGTAKEAAKHNSDDWE